MHRPRSNGNGRDGTDISAGDGYAELDRRILHSLDSNGRKMTARELADCMDTAPRRVVGRLQALRRQGAVAFTRNGSAPSAPGLWMITEREGAYR